MKDNESDYYKYKFSAYQCTLRKKIQQCVRNKKVNLLFIIYQPVPEHHHLANQEAVQILGQLHDQ